MAKLGRTLSYHLQSWYWSIFSRRSGRTCNTTSLKCKQPKDVLLLISIFMINLCVLHIKCLYCSSFSLFKCLNLNPIMTGVLELDDLGQLTLIPSSFKCLNLDPIMTGVLEPDDLGQLTLISSSFKCLNLNPIMTRVLGPDDSGQLTLIPSSLKCLNLNLIMTKVLGPDDLS